MFRLALLLFLLVSYAACSGTDATVPPVVRVSTITIAGGSGQTANKHRTLDAPLTVQAVNTNGTAAVNVEIDWAVTSGGGQLSETSTRTNVDGKSSVSWTLGQWGPQSATATAPMVTAPPVQFTATATAPIVIHFDGSKWTTMLEDTSSVGIVLNAIWGSADSDVFAVGSCAGTSVVLHYDGVRWTPPPRCSSFIPPFLYKSIWGNSASDVFVLGFQPDFGRWVDHYDGHAWSQITSCPAFLITGPCRIEAIWSRTATDVIGVGYNGEIWHYDGTRWNLERNNGPDLFAVWGTGSGPGVFAVGDRGEILYHDGITWREQVSRTAQLLRGVWGTSVNDVFAVGDGGTILHYDGTAWTPQTSGAIQTLLAVGGSSSSSVFAVGPAGIILHYDGSRWTPQSANASIGLMRVWGRSPTSVFAVGYPR